MQVEEKSRRAVKSPKNPSQKSSSGGARRSRNRTFRLKLKVVKLYLEENMTAQEVAKIARVSKQSVYRWASLYKKQGEEAVRTGPGKATFWVFGRRLHRRNERRKVIAGSRSMTA